MSRAVSPGAVLFAVVLAGALVLMPASGFAQNTCEAALRTASDLFNQGKFEAARQAALPCLDARPTRVERSRTLALLARIFLVQDDLPAAEATVGRLLASDPDFQADIFDSPRFIRMLTAVRGRSSTPTVTSVSKAKEPLAEAPATVAVITGADIERRGYTDLEAVLRDLPGFDFSRRAGASYSNIYQRGYRSIETNRTMLLIDGVEDNDLASSTAWLSRQFPLSNIDRIEIVYGPASTMYGANAFAGVINVVTKQPEQIVAEGKRLGGDARMLVSNNANALDGVVAGQNAAGNLRWSLAARRYTGDDLPGLDNEPQWDFDPATYDAIDYTRVGALNPTSAAAIANVRAKYTEAQLAPFFTVVTDAAGNWTAIRLTPEGAARARALDKSAYEQTVGGQRIAPGSPVDDWMLDFKVSTSNTLFGVQRWRTREAGSVPLVDTFAASGRNGFLWTPEHLSVYMKNFARYLDDKVQMQLSTQFNQHSLDGTDSANIFLQNYQLGSLQVNDLVAGQAPRWNPQYNYRLNNRLRSELNLFYERSERLNIVGGLEARYSSVGANNITSATAPADETGATPAGVLGGNQIGSRDLGLYAQASWRARPMLKLVAGGRVDNNTIRQNGGYGTVFNPRLAGVYTRQRKVFKVMYAEAFQDAPNFQKYQTAPGIRELSNPGLKPEKVKNFEASASWEPRPTLAFQLVGYRSKYSGIVQEVSNIPCPQIPGCTTTNQFRNVGRLAIKGLQADARWTPDAYRFQANYTFTSPRDPDRDQRVGDIAGHRLNFLGGTRLFRDRLDTELRVNGVLGRKTGAGTTVNNNPFPKIADYFIVSAAFTYRRLVPGVDLQFSVENLFNQDYWDPSLRNPGGFPIAARIPQPGTTAFLRLRVTR
jgi:outer membrane receptor protein involved in Fe transport